MGNPTETLLDLKLSPVNIENKPPLELLYFKHCTEDINFDNIRPMTTAVVIPRHSKLEVGLDYAIPALLGEWFEVKISINNAEMSHIKDMKVEVNLSNDETISLSKY